MVKQQSKQKSRNAPGIPKRATPRRTETRSTSPSGSQWSDEIQALRGQTFANLECAIESLAEAVLEKAGSTPEIREQEKRFLIDLLRTDVQICEILRGALKIG